ncbi:MAG: hypothetical protein MJ237_08570 [bacterium]|nr:hypothetical protein [bacterium]
MNNELKRIFKERNEIYYKIKKEYEKLNVPKEFKWFPNVSDASYYVGVSDRSRTKTTNSLLFALIGKALFNYDSAYIRSTKGETTRGKMTGLYNTINKCGYVEKLFPQYTHVKYKWNSKCFVLANDTEESDPFMYVLSVDEWENYKSSLVVPDCNIFIYDEFIGTYLPDLFIHFMDLHKTLSRERFNVYTIMLANTMNRNSPWFDEMGLRKHIPKIKRGDCKLIETDKGTFIRFELFGSVLDSALGKIRSIVNSLYYGFNSPKMSTITGDSFTWGTGIYPIIEYMDDDVVVYNKIKLKYNNQYYSFTLVNNSKLGLHINIKPCSRRIKEDDIIIVTTTPTERNETYLFTKLDFIRTFFIMKKVFYSDSYTGDDIRDFVKYNL